MALNPVNVSPKVKRSGGKGGLFGKIAGGVVGGIAGAFAGNPIAGASIGSAVGGTVGSIADPVKEKVVGETQVPLSTMADQPGVKLASLVDTQKDLMQSPDFTEPEKEELMNSVFNPTIMALKKRIG